MKNTILLIGVCALLSIIGCKKYNDGPGISLLSKKERVANTWEIDEAREDGRDVTNDYDEFTLQLLYDGDASLAALYTFGNVAFEYETDGTWEFQNDKKEISLDFEDDDADRVYVILRLKEDELWLREKGHEVELKLDPK